MGWFAKKVIGNVLASVIGMVVIRAFISLEHPLMFLKTAFLYLIAVIIVIAVVGYLRYFVPLRKEQGFPFVYVESDGTVRELNAKEQAYLNTEFSPGDGGRPYIKNRYSQKSYGGGISGFIYRDRVPRAVVISPESSQVLS
ncbi:hypothetical protein [Hymenobacter negativus]|uniref:Uncharacterized protein n=1 Tax=Hymenobacter negativus TaxID=2795026 RepID=A0ABS0Q5X7_9BACT|nr:MULTISPECIES: hypothetical protein [Bacteria]MBH8558061.1 hypothetical protein [Hymenobacter negativus]MBH8568551.1 hypothetical protein [Hymenobacter negativus]MBR7208285.1 hypothetical protein [Microvirga sp. STS02]